jgi:hypothetical protein
MEVLRHRHPDTQFSRLVTERNNAAVIVAEHRNRLVPEVRPENPPAAAVKIITIDDCLHLSQVLNIAAGGL